MKEPILLVIDLDFQLYFFMMATIVTIFHRFISYPTFFFHKRRLFIKVPIYACFRLLLCQQMIFWNVIFLTILNKNYLYYLNIF